VVTREPTPTMNIRGLLIPTVALPGNATEGTHRVGPKDIYMACKTDGGSSPCGGGLECLHRSPCES
jgi:hypothetical protein